MPTNKTISLKDSLPTIVAVEGRDIDLFDINNYINNASNEPIEFSATLSNGNALPAGLKCGNNGKITGKPKKGTASDNLYNLNITVQSKTAVGLRFPASLKIYTDDAYRMDVIQRNNLANYWSRFQEGLPLPDIEEILNRKISKTDIYWLLSRFATLTVWNGDDLSSPDNGKLIDVANVSDKFNVYEFYNDQGKVVAIVGNPKELFDHDRTLGDAIQTARAMAHEIKDRGWNPEMAGFGAMTMAFWMEVQSINDTAGKEQKIEIYHYQPTDSAYYLYQYLYQQQAVSSAPVKEMT